MRLATFVAIALVALLAIAAHPAAAKDSKADKARAKVARELVAWAGWCSRNDAPEQGTAALDTAHELGAENTAPLVADLGDADQLADEAAIARGLKVHGPKIAKAYEELARAKHAAEEAARFAAYRLEGLRWDPTKARAKKVAKWAAGLKDRGLGARMLAQAWAACGEGDAAAAITAAFSARASGELVLLGSASHPLVAFVSLPRSWKRGKSYPVLIGVDGAGSGFEGYGKKSASVRGSRNVIGLYPMTLSNTNTLNAKKYPYYEQQILDEHSGVAKRLEFDLAGVNAVLALLQAHVGAEEKVFLTGFSGGGQFTYLKLLQEPQTVAGAVPCCGNFGGGGVQGAPRAGADGGPPVLLLTGENDKHRDFTHGDKSSPGIEPQTDAAEQALAQLGYQHVTRRMLPVGHSPLHDKVWEFVDEVLEEKR